MKVAIYVRVSTEDQTTLNQEIILKEYCARHNYVIYRVYKDEGVSGAKTSRPALDQMLQDMRQRHFDAIVIWKVDRLGRSLTHLLQILSEMQNKKVNLIVTDQGIDTSTPVGRAFFQMSGIFAEFERELIRERVKAGMRRARKQGLEIGRPAGSRDKRPRRKSGYYNRWSKKSPP